MKHLFLLFVFVTCSMVSEAFACSCLMPSTAKEAFDKAKAVFAAHVDEFKKNEQGYVEEIILKIDKVWKGSPDEDFIVVVPNRGCAYGNFEDDKSYLIYAHPSWDKNNPDGYEITICSRTKPLNEGQIETRYLDAIIENKDTKSIDLSLPNILTDENENNNIRIEAAQLLGWMIRMNPEKAPKGALEAMVNASKSDDTTLKITVANSLSNSSFKKRSDVKEALLHLLNDDEQNIRNAAAGALAMAASHDSEVFQALVKSIENAKIKKWNDTKLYETTLTALGVSIAKVASTEEEKTKTANLLHNMIDQINDPYNKVSIIQHLGFQKKYAAKSAPKLLEVLKTTEHYHVKQYTLSALGDIKSTKELDEIKSYVTHENCYVAKHSVEAVHKIDPDGFPEFFKNIAMPEMKNRFENCKHEFIWALQILGSDAKALKPFLVEKYNDMQDGNWLKDQLKSVIEAFN